MYHVASRTLKYYKTQVALQSVDMRHASMPSVVDALIWYQKSASPAEVCVEEQALRFYLLNDAFAKLSAKYDENELLPGPVVALCDDYCMHLALMGRRLFSYVLMITTRESRHLGSGVAFREKVKDLFGSEYSTFRNSLPHSSDGAVKKLKSNPPKMEIGKYAEAMTYVFNKGSFSGGYGGKPWGNIAHTLEKYVKGETSLEMFIDTAWTLAHNNGPMFNKGMLYQMYSSDLITILDVQSSGQMTQFLQDCMVGMYGVKGSSQVADSLTVVLAALPEITGQYMDWYLLEQLGAAKKQYPQYKAIQVKKYGPPAHEAAAQAQELMKFYVSSSDFAMKVQRSAA